MNTHKRIITECGLYFQLFGDHIPNVGDDIDIANVTIRVKSRKFYYRIDGELMVVRLDGQLVQGDD